MLPKISTWILLISAASSILASPLLPSKSKRSVESDIVDRQFECPGGKCGPGPECATIFCHLPTCVDAPLCQNTTSKRSAAATLADRQFNCPSGVNCGHGPECTLETCDLPGCADAEVCQDNADKKRSAETDIVHPICDVCYQDDNGNTVCGCNTSSVGVKRRGTEQPCPDYCIFTEDGETLCGCAAEAYEKSLKGSARMG